MSEKYETLLHRWFDEVWNQGNEAAIDEIFPDGIAHGLGDEKVRGAEGYKVFFRSFKEAFPDIKITVEDWVLDGDKLAVNCRAQASHTGKGLGFNPTNLAVDFPFMGFARIKDNQILEAWNIVDFMKLYQQLGVLSLNQNEEKQDKNEKVLRRWFDEVWNQKNEAAIDDLLDDECVHHGLGGVEKVEIRGKEAFKQFYHAFIAAFPDIEVTVEDVIEVGEKLCARCTVRGNHSGDGLGIAATNKSFEFTGNGLCTIRNGKFVEVWNEFDFLKLYSQLGLTTLNLK